MYLYTKLCKFYILFQSPNINSFLYGLKVKKFLNYLFTLIHELGQPTNFESNGRA